MKVTEACALGKHKLCDGTGNDADRPTEEEPKPFTCECPCHSDAGQEERRQEEAERTRQREEREGLSPNQDRILYAVRGSVIGGGRGLPEAAVAEDADDVEFLIERGLIERHGLQEAFRVLKPKEATDG